MSLPGSYFTYTDTFRCSKGGKIDTEDDTLICPSSIEYQDERGDLFWRVFFEISGDEGKSWEATDFINDRAEFDAIQLYEE